MVLTESHTLGIDATHYQSFMPLRGALIDENAFRLVYLHQPNLQAQRAPVLTAPFKARI